MEPYDPQVRCAGQGDNGIVYKVRIYVDRAKLSSIKSELYKKIMKELSDKNLIASSMRRDVNIILTEESSSLKVLTMKST